MSDWYPSSKQLSTPEESERTIRRVLQIVYGMRTTTPAPVSGAKTLTAGGPTNSYLVGLPVIPIDPTTLADATVLTFVKNARNLQFKTGGGGGAGVTSLNALAGVLTIAAGTGISVGTGGSTITITATGGTGVTSLNALTGALSITAGLGITVTPSGSNIQIAATGGVVPSFADAETPSGTINGSNTAFTLAFAPSPAASLQLYKNGLIQFAGGVDYTLSGANITYVTAPITGDTLIAWYRH